MTGIPAATKKRMRITAETTLPSTIEKGDMQVVSMMSNVCRSFSPEIDDAVMIGTISATMHTCATASTGNR